MSRTINDALNLEVMIVEALLSRNRPTHGRTIYYKRMQMVLQCLRKCRLLDFSSLLRKLLDETRSSKSASTKRQEDLGYLSETLSVSFPELISRIAHASKAFFTEIGRGFFLPYCTVAVSALARIRILVLQMGHDGIMQMHEVGIDLSHCLKDYAVTEERDLQILEQSNHFKLLYKSVGMTWKDTSITSRLRSRQDSKEDSSDEKMRTIESSSSELASSSHTTPSTRDFDPEDLGLNVGLDQKNAVVAVKFERVDHNFEVMNHIKPILAKNKKERKRKLDKDKRSEGSAEKPRVKKKRNKDFFDELFGD